MGCPHPCGLNLLHAALTVHVYAGVFSSFFSLVYWENESLPGTVFAEFHLIITSV